MYEGSSSSNRGVVGEDQSLPTASRNTIRFPITHFANVIAREAAEAEATCSSSGPRAPCETCGAHREASAAHAHSSRPPHTVSNSHLNNTKSDNNANNNFSSNSVNANFIADEGERYKADVERRIAALTALYRDTSVPDAEVGHFVLGAATQCARYAEALSFGGRFPEAFGMLEECERLLSEDRDFSEEAEAQRLAEAEEAEAAVRAARWGHSHSPAGRASAPTPSYMYMYNSNPHTSTRSMSSASTGTTYTSAQHYAASSGGAPPTQVGVAGGIGTDDGCEESAERPSSQKRTVLVGPDFAAAVTGLRRRLLFLAKETELKRRRQLASVRKKEEDDEATARSASARRTAGGLTHTNARPVSAGPTADACVTCGAVVPRSAAGEASPPEALRGIMSAARRNVAIYQRQQTGATRDERIESRGQTPAPPSSQKPLSVGLAIPGTTAAGMSPREFYYRQYDPPTALASVLRDEAAYRQLVAAASSVAVRHRPKPSAHAASQNAAPQPAAEEGIGRIAWAPQQQAKSVTFGLLDSAGTRTQPPSVGALPSPPSTDTTVGSGSRCYTYASLRKRAALIGEPSAQGEEATPSGGAIATGQTTSLQATLAAIEQKRKAAIEMVQRQFAEAELAGTTESV